MTLLYWYIFCMSDSGSADVRGYLYVILGGRWEAIIWTSGGFREGQTRLDYLKLTSLFLGRPSSGTRECQGVWWCVGKWLEASFWGRGTRLVCLALTSLVLSRRNIIAEPSIGPYLFDVIIICTYALELSHNCWNYLGYHLPSLFWPSICNNSSTIVVIYRLPKMSDIVAVNGSYQPTDIGCELDL